jgi:hypothetical protein
MSEQPEATLVLELADVVTELTRRQGELVEYLKGFRTDFLEEPARVDAYQPPPPRLVQPPAPLDPRPTPSGQSDKSPPWGPGAPRTPTPTILPAPLVAAPSPPQTRDPGPELRATEPMPAIAVPQATPSPVVGPPTNPLEVTMSPQESVLQPTKRDYDYFAELDDLLSRLPLNPDPQDPSPLPDQ